MKQERYKSEDGTDLIDKWAEEKSHDEFRTIMWAMVEKYQCRLGKKDHVESEVGKMADYMQRWYEYEKKWKETLPAVTQ